MSNHRTHYQIEKRMSKRAESALDYLAVIAIAAGLAFVIGKWWLA